MGFSTEGLQIYGVSCKHLSQLTPCLGAHFLVTSMLQGGAVWWFSAPLWTHAPCDVLATRGLLCGGFQPHCGPMFPVTSLLQGGCCVVVFSSLCVPPCSAVWRQDSSRASCQHVVLGLQGLRLRDLGSMRRRPRKASTSLEASSLGADREEKGWGNRGEVGRRLGQES